MAGGARYGSDRLRTLYNGFARYYDLVEGTTDHLLRITGKRRRWLMQATAPVLEIGAGTGRGLRAYQGLSPVVLTDLSEEMLKRARMRAYKHRVAARFLQVDAARLPFRDDAFSTVVSSLTLCTLPDPIASIREMARVCEPGGSLLFVEHGRSHWCHPLNSFLDRGAERHYRSLGCRWNQDVPALLREAGLQIKAERRSHFGLLVRVHARPGLPRQAR